MCALGKQNYWIKTTMHKKISHMLTKCNYEKLKQKITKCLICFPNPKVIQPPRHFLHQRICKPILSLELDICTW